MSSIKLLTFDLDNTLWDVDQVIVRAETELREWLQQHEPGAAEVYQSPRLSDIRTEVMAREHAKRHDLSHMRIEILNQVMREAGVSQATTQALAAFEVFYEGRNRVEFFPGALDMLAHLSAKYPLIALTNGNADIAKAGVGEYFSGAFSSATVGTSKPQPQMFQAALSQQGIEPFEAVHIGDNLHDDVAGAQAVGMHTIWVNLERQEGTMQSTERSAPTAEVNTLADIPNVVSSLSS